MKQLLIDAGNSRLKWTTLTTRAAAATLPARDGAARGRKTRLGRVSAEAWTERSAPRIAAAMMRARFDRILVCSVAGRGLESVLRHVALRQRQPVPQFIRSTRRAAGVRNGYAQTWRLGADRWVAMLGARALYPGRALCVVDVGTALTVDLLDSRGQHRGGLLIPGPSLMVDALLNYTAGIRRRAGPRAGEGARRGAGTRGGAGSGAGRATLFARSTQAGLLSGSAMACAALVERAQAEARTSLGVRPKVLLAGGGAMQVAPLLGVAHTRVDELVLRGLGLLAMLDSR